GPKGPARQRPLRRTPVPAHSEQADRNTRNAALRRAGPTGEEGRSRVEWRWGRLVDRWRPADDRPRFGRQTRGHRAARAPRDWRAGGKYSSNTVRRWGCAGADIRSDAL